jgi:hypothetical protein
MFIAPGKAVADAAADAKIAAAASVIIILFSMFFLFGKSAAGIPVFQIPRNSRHLESQVLRISILAAKYSKTPCE